MTEYCFKSPGEIENWLYKLEMKEHHTHTHTTQERKKKS